MNNAKFPERADRLQKFFNDLNIKKVDAAKRLGLKRAVYISRLTKKQSTITTDAAIKIAKAYPALNVNWLLHGIGEMLIKQDSPDRVEEPHARYGDPLDGLRELLHTHEQQLKEQGEQIKYLLNEVRLLKKGGGTNVGDGEES